MEPAAILIVASLMLVTVEVAFSIDHNLDVSELPPLPEHPPETEEEREAIEIHASKIALSDERVKALMEEKTGDYKLQSNCYTMFHVNFTPQGQNFELCWDGKLRGQLVIIYEDSSIYYVHVDVTDGKIGYVGYIKWDWIDPISHTTEGAEPLEWINIFLDGKAHNLIDQELSQETIGQLRGIWVCISYCPSTRR